MKIMKHFANPLRLLGLAALSLAALQPASAQSYAFTDVGKGNGSAINDYGQVVSGSQLWTPNVAGGTTGSAATMNLPANSSGGLAINSGGQVVGYFNVTDKSGVTVGHAFVWLPTVPNGSVGTSLDLNTTLPPGSGWFLKNARCINDAGAIVGEGQYTDLNGVVHTAHYLWSRDPLTLAVTVSFLPAGESGNGDNASLNNVSPPQVNILNNVWQNGTGTSLGLLSSFRWAEGRHINLYGQVAGEAQTLTTMFHCFLSTPSLSGGLLTYTMQDLNPPGFYQSYGRGMNDQGQVVGWGMPVGPATGLIYAAVWDATGYHSLADLTTIPAAWQTAYSPLREAYAINNRGQISGWGWATVTTTTTKIVHNKPVTTTTTVSEMHGFLLTPQ